MNRNRRRPLPPHPRTNNRQLAPRNRRNTWARKIHRRFESDTTKHRRNLDEERELRPTRFEVWVPYSCDSDKRFLHGIIYEGEGRYWYIEGKDAKFNTPDMALAQIMEDLEISRQVMLNDEFNSIMGGA